METKVFSVKDGSIEAMGENISLWDDNTCLVATTNKFLLAIDNSYLLPSSLIHTPKSDEELAIEAAKNRDISWQPYVDGFLYGRKSFGDKEFHLTREELEKVIKDSRVGNVENNRVEFLFTCGRIINQLITYIYPHTITVDYDGNNYLWETLKAEY